MMRNRRIGLILALLLPAALLLSACDSGQNVVPTAQTGSIQTNRTIKVVGQGKASGAPDVAHINIGVETTGVSAQEAMEANRQQMSALLAKIKAMGVADKDVQTSNFSIYAERTDLAPSKTGTTEPSDQAIVYRVNNMVNVTVRDLASLGDVLDQAVSAGANNIYGVSFEVSDTSKLEADAREKAIADAKARAESLARLSGVSLAEVQQVSEVVSGTGPLYGKVAAEGLGVGTPIEAGELLVTMSVEVTYAIK
jgi:uncharacterized protein YggE